MIAYYYLPLPQTASILADCVNKNTEQWSVRDCLQIPQ